MSVEGVSNNLDKNSGEIKVNLGNTMTIATSDNENNTLVLLGYSTGGCKRDEEHVNNFCKQIETSIDESAVILSGVGEWLRNKSELYSENIKNDFLYFSSDETSANYDITRTLSPIGTEERCSVSRTNVNNTSWDDFVLDSDSVILRDSNNVVLDSQVKSDTEHDIITSKGKECSPPNKMKIIPPVKLFTENKTLDPEPAVQVEIVPSENRTHDPRDSVKFINKSLPFIKIPKNCLMKGKILGKGDISLLSGKCTISFLNGSKSLKNISKVRKSIGISNTNKLEVAIKKTQNNSESKIRTTLNTGRPNGKSILMLPVKSENTTSNTLSSNVRHSRSLLKNNTSSKSINANSSIKKSVDGAQSINKNTSLQKVPVALVAISTNKSDNTTEIIIKTEEGENFFKGKTSDIMKATGSSTECNRTKSSEKIKTSTTSKQEYDDATINELMMKLFGVSGDALEHFEGVSTQTHLKCPVDGCKYTSLKGSWLKVHVLQHYGIRPFKCDYPDCTWAFYTKFRLKRHQEIHCKKKEYCCPVAGCGRSFSTIYNVNSHLKLHERPTAVTCYINECNRAFQTRRSYEKHLMEHGIEYAPYTCMKEGCGKKYFTVNSLNSHSRIHQHNEDELRCSYCNRMFDQPCRLKAHINTHIGVRPYKCDFEGCMWAFTTSSKLRRHQRKHTQMRKHLCKVCNKSFLRSEHLKDHSLKHFVKKSFICPFSGCATVFANKSSMYAHLKKHRNQESKSSEVAYFPCPMDNCNLIFNTKESLRTHMQLNHVLSGIMNNDNSQDTIQMLTDDNLITLDSLHSNAPNTGSGMVSFNSMSQEGLLVGMSDLVQCMPVTEQGDFSESNSSNNIITHVVFTDDLVAEEDQVLEEITELTETEQSIGSARTGIPYLAGTKDKQPSSLVMAGGLHSASDVVLSAGLLAGQDNLERGLLLQDELSGGDLYPSQEESGLLGTSGELQVLLLDPTTREQTSEFEQSTINLRDLE